MKTFNVTNIVWDTDDMIVDLPTTLTVEAECVEDIADIISDQHGFCVMSIDVDG